MKFLVRTFLSWLPLAVAISGISLLVYGTVQQNYSQSLNDPQVQIAEDTAVQLADGSSPEQIVPAPGEIDMINSLAPWVAVYSSAGVPLISSGEENGDMPLLPNGVFTAARANAGKDTTQQYEDRITWQSAAGVRQAVVVVYVPQADQFIASGRNMREVENREGQLTTFVGLAWIALMGATFIAQVFARLFV